MSDLSLMHDVDRIIASDAPPHVKQDRIRALAEGHPKMLELVLDALVLKSIIQHGLIRALKRGLE